MEGLIIAKPGGERRGARLSFECVPTPRPFRGTPRLPIRSAAPRVRNMAKARLPAFRTRRGAANWSPRPGVSPLISPAAGAAASKLASSSIRARSVKLASAPPAPRRPDAATPTPTGIPTGAPSPTTTAAATATPTRTTPPRSTTAAPSRCGHARAPTSVIAVGRRRVDNDDGRRRCPLR
jgi:hypothetical protein